MVRSVGGAVVPGASCAGVDDRGSGQVCHLPPPSSLLRARSDVHGSMATRAEAVRGSCDSVCDPDFSRDSPLTEGRPCHGQLGDLGVHARRGARRAMMGAVIAAGMGGVRRPRSDSRASHQTLLHPRTHVVTPVDRSDILMSRDPIVGRYEILPQPDSGSDSCSCVGR